MLVSSMWPRSLCVDILHHGKPFRATERLEAISYFRSLLGKCELLQHPGGLQLQRIGGATPPVFMHVVKGLSKSPRKRRKAGCERSILLVQGLMRSVFTGPLWESSTIAGLWCAPETVRMRNFTPLFMRSVSALVVHGTPEIPFISLSSATVLGQGYRNYLF